MNTQRIVDQPNLIIEAVVREKWLEVTWIGEMSEHEVMAGCSQIEEAMVQTGFAKIIKDVRRVTTLWDSSVEWVNEYWMPHIFKLGGRYMAIIAHETPLHKQLIAGYVQGIINGPILKIFETKTEAEEWIRHF
ncbi:MAG TPA: hypothetical protein VHK69_04680 [Chitinophagaceae bacterium]|jgi:hypothetical protein|nr:hypothetical protein [Chitinophagaceae bacterium]